MYFSKKPIQFSEEINDVINLKSEILSKIQNLNFLYEELVLLSNLEKSEVYSNGVLELKKKVEDIYKQLLETLVLWKSFSKIHFLGEKKLESIKEDIKIDELSEHILYLDNFMNRYFLTPKDQLNKIRFRRFIFSLSFISLFGFLIFSYYTYRTPEEKKFDKRISFLNSFKNMELATVRIADLSKIAIALEKYKLTHKRYPVTKTWQSRLYPTRFKNNEWIPGLVPKYLKSMPVDPDFSSLPFRQYIYKSDGRDYKLLSHKCPELNQVMSYGLYLLSDPKRIPYSYGFWTKGAKDW